MRQSRRVLGLDYIYAQSCHTEDIPRRNAALDSTNHLAVKSCKNRPTNRSNGRVTPLFRSVH